MNKQRITQLLVSLFAIVIIFSGCTTKVDSENSLDTFVIELKDNGYEVDMHDVEPCFIPTVTKEVTINDHTITIYIFDDARAMEQAAQKIDPEGFSFTDTDQAVQAEWVSVPHFYQSDNLIIQYIGTEEQLIADLEEILGEQFAGTKKDQESSS